MKRNEYWDIVRGIAIMNVVIGHAAVFPYPLAVVMNFYHCGLFFFISGALFKDKNAHDPILYIGKKLKSIYLPAVMYAVLFILLNNVFLKLNIYTTVSNQYNVSAKPYLTAGQMLSQIFEAVIKSQYAVELLGAVWMVYPIMLASIFFCFVMYILEKMKMRTELVVSICCIGIGVVGYSLLQHSLFLTWRAETALLVLPLVISGYLFSHHFRIEDLHISDALISCVILAWLYFGGLDISYASGVINDLVGFYVSSLAGFCLVLYCSKIIEKTFLKKLFAYAGKHSFDIMALHFLAFKAVNVLDVLVNQKNWGDIACFPTSNASQFKLLYLLAGMGLPMLVGFAKEKITPRLKFGKYNDK